MRSGNEAVYAHVPRCCPALVNLSLSKLCGPFGAIGFGKPTAWRPLARLIRGQSL